MGSFVPPEEFLNKYGITVKQYTSPNFVNIRQKRKQVRLEFRYKTAIETYKFLESKGAEFDPPFQVTFRQWKTLIDRFEHFYFQQYFSIDFVDLKLPYYYPFTYKDSLRDTCEPLEYHMRKIDSLVLGPQYLKKIERKYNRGRWLSNNF